MCMFDSTMWANINPQKIPLSVPVFKTHFRFLTHTHTLSLTLSLFLFPSLSLNYLQSIETESCLTIHLYTRYSLSFLRVKDNFFQRWIKL